MKVNFISRTIDLFMRSFLLCEMNRIELKWNGKIMFLIIPDKQMIKRSFKQKPNKRKTTSFSVCGFYLIIIFLYTLLQFMKFVLTSITLFFVIVKFYYSSWFFHLGLLFYGCFICVYLKV